MYIVIDTDNLLPIPDRCGIFLASGKNAFVIVEVTGRSLLPGHSRFLRISSDVRVLFVKFMQ